MAAAEILSPPCELFAARLVRPVEGWLMLSTAFRGQPAFTMNQLLRQAIVDAFGRAGRRVTLPITNLGDGRWIVRFVSRQTPRLVDAAGQRLIVEPGKGSILQAVTELRPMLSCVGIIPIMQQIRVLEFIETVAKT